MMKKDYLDIIKEKEFIALNAVEREEVAEVCATEEEFNAMKAMLLQIDVVAAEPIIPNTKTKESLDSLFAQTYPKAAPIWYNSVFAVIVPKEKPIYRQPLAQIAAVFLIGWMVFPFFNEPLLQENKQVAKVETKELEQPVEDVKEAQTKNEAAESVTSAIPQESNQVTDIPVQQPARTRGFAESVSTMSVFDAELSDAVLSEDETIAWEESTHPDGIFIGAEDRSIAFAQSASESQDLLDLLTPTF